MKDNAGEEVRTHKRRSLHGRAGVRRPARNYLQQLCSREDLPEVMYERDEWREREREREVGGTVLTARHDDDEFCKGKQK